MYKKELIALMIEYDVAEEDVRVESCSDSSCDKPQLQGLLAIIESEQQEKLEKSGMPFK